MRCRRFTAILATVHTMRVHAMRLHALRHETARRRFILNTASLLPASLLPAAITPAPARAADEKSAVFSGGAACYLQPFFDEIRYKGVTRTEVGRVDDAANTRALRVFYNPDKCSYKALLGVYWRHVDPTRATQFPLDASEEGDAFRTVIWVADAEERKLAEQSRKVMESAEVYGKNRKFLTEILDEKPFTPTPEDGQDLYTADAKAYEKAIKKSGRAKFFEKTYEPVTTTACEERTCGYVYFPCSAENGCMGIVSGRW
uniref:peptide-methionine (S)-S-oxide reductase n=1 Tax=Pelagomonas calceolata TaxID=35677 RepID=A0A7S4E8F2_9STRA|mmetsp:Transcript_10885/g.33655  ORF Transcript_10885/g.33655 Transcript_10885/m.33655 type:complete len:259 (+) Transcript_10885:84-860(+)